MHHRRRQWETRSYVGFREFPDQSTFVFSLKPDAIGAVGENEAGDILREGPLIGLNEDSTDRGSNQNERPFFAGGVQEGMKVVDCLLDGLLGRAGIAPSQTSPIVGADPSRFGDFQLHKCPID